MRTIDTYNVWHNKGDRRYFEPVYKELCANYFIL